MSKKHFIALADAIKEHNRCSEFYHDPKLTRFTMDQMDALGSFCRQQNPQFNCERWIGYIAGECGPNGGAIK